MPYQNLSFTLNSADRDLILQKMDEMKTLMPFMVNMSVADKKKGRKLGAKSEKLFIDALFLLESNQQFVPAFVNVPEYAKDINALVDLLAVEFKLRTLLEGVADTRLALMQEMMPPALALYSNIKQAAKANVPGSDSALQRLQPYFKLKRKKK